MPLFFLFVLFIVLPIAELYVIIQVGQAIGVVPTLLDPAHRRHPRRRADPLAGPVGLASLQPGDRRRPDPGEGGLRRRRDHRRRRVPARPRLHHRLHRPLPADPADAGALRPDPEPRRPASSAPPARSCSSTTGSRARAIRGGPGPRAAAAPADSNTLCRGYDVDGTAREIPETQRDRARPRRRRALSLRLLSFIDGEAGYCALVAGGAGSRGAAARRPGRDDGVR